MVVTTHILEQVTLLLVVVCLFMALLQQPSRSTLQHLLQINSMPTPLFLLLLTQLVAVVDILMHSSRHLIMQSSLVVAQLQDITTPITTQAEMSRSRIVLTSRHISLRSQTSLRLRLQHKILIILTLSQASLMAPSLLVKIFAPRRLHIRIAWVVCLLLMTPLLGLLAVQPLKQSDLILV